MEAQERLWVWYRIHWGRPIQFEKVAELLELLASDDLGDDIVYEIHGVAGSEVIFMVATHPAYSSELKRSFEVMLPGTILEELCGGDAQKLRVQPKVAYSVRFGLVTVLETERSAIMGKGLLSALHSIEGREGAVLQIFMLRNPEPPRELPHNIEDPRVSVFERIMHGPSILPEPLRSGLSDRYSMHKFFVEIRIGVVAEDIAHEHWLLDRIRSVLKIMETQGTSIEFREDSVGDQLYVMARPKEWRAILSSTEVACIMGAPCGSDDMPGVSSVHPLILRSPDGLEGSSRGFAISNDPSHRIPLGINPIDSLRHTLLMGPSGVGKSTAMLHMILRDISDGFGVIVIDPKGDLNDSILARMEVSRAKDVVYINPGGERVVSINPLRANGTDPDIVADGVLAVFRGIFSASWGQRMEDILSNALMTLIRTTDNATIAMLPYLLTDANFRKSKIEKVTKDDPIGLGLFWKKFEALSSVKQDELIAPIMSKLRTVLTRKSLLDVIGQVNPSFQLEDVFTKGRIVLISLNKASVGTTSSRFLGSMILSQLWNLTQKQSRIEEVRRPIVKVYIDEMQDYLSLPIDMADALSQARGYHVGFTLAHQYRDQIKDRELLSAIDANVAHKLFFTLNDPDARTIAAMSHGLHADDFKLLPAHHVYMQTYHEGRKVWLSAKTLPAPDEINNVQIFKQYSLQRYGRSAS